MPGLPGVTTTSAVRLKHMGQRVLAAPAADDADPHAAAKETNCSRPGPTPTSRTGTPI